MMFLFCLCGLGYFIRTEKLFLFIFISFIINDISYLIYYSNNVFKMREDNQQQSWICIVCVKSSTHSRSLQITVSVNAS